VGVGRRGLCIGGGGVSQIIHRCKACGKPDYWRDGTIAGGRTRGGEQPDPIQVRSCCRAKAWGDPELVPTFDDRGEPIAAVVKPGGPAGSPGVKTCNCDDCEAFYAAMVS